MDAIKFIQDGGFFMYPILLVFAAGLGILIERMIVLNRAKQKSRELWARVQPKLQAGQLQEAAKLVQNDSSEAGRILNYGLTTALSGDTLEVHALTREAADSLLEGDMDRRVTRLEGGN